MIANADTPLIDVNPRRFQIQTPKVWRSPDGDKERVGKESRFAQLATVDLTMKRDFPASLNH
jgi:hypothetical protein